MFADYGKSGKTIKGRQEFLRMIDLARSGGIDKIYYKSISRFSRNTIDFLTIVSELRSKNIEIYFEQEDISTLDNMADIMLTTWSALAQQQLQEISDNQKWSARKRFANGHVELNNNIFGYDLIPSQGDGNMLVINKNQAPIVRLIFELYSNGYGLQRICNELEKQGVKTALGHDKWHINSIKTILKNEKYIGDSMLQKSYKESFNKVLNDSTKPKVTMQYIENSHEPIIDKETWLKVQRIMQEKTAKHNKQSANVIHIFSGKIQCSVCGSKFKHKGYKSYNGQTFSTYVCNGYDSRGKGYCNNHTIYEDTLCQLFLESYEQWRKIKVETDKLNEIETEIEELSSRLNEIGNLYSNNYISKLNYEYEKDLITRQITDRQNSLELRSKVNVMKLKPITIEQINHELVEKLIDKITIQDWQVTFTFINGISITKGYQNPKSGNLKGWKDKQIKEEEKVG